MIVTSSTLLGLTSTNGSLEMHLSMLIMLLWKVELLKLPTMPVGHSKDEVHMQAGTLYWIAVATHAYLFATCALNQSPSIANGVMLQIANFTGLGLYIYYISKVAIELYDSKPLGWMQSEPTIVGNVWLTIEIVTFFGTLIVNIVFMFLRSLKEVEVRIELMDRKK